MTDTQIDKVLAQDGAIASVLLARGGWMKAQAIRMRVAFPADSTSPAVWAIELVGEDDAPWHTVYAEATHVVAISVRGERLDLQPQ